MVTYPMAPRGPLKWFDLLLGRRRPTLSAPGNQSSPACVKISVFCLRITAHCEGPANHFLLYYASCQITVRAAALPEEQGAGWDRPLQLSQALCPFSGASVCPGAGWTGPQPHSPVDRAARHYKGPAQRLLTLWC